MAKIDDFLSKIEYVLDVVLKLYNIIKDWIPKLETIRDFINENNDLSDDDLARKLAKQFPIQNLHNWLDLKIYEVLVRWLRRAKDEEEVEDDETL